MPFQFSASLRLGASALVRSVQSLPVKAISPYNRPRSLEEADVDHDYRLSQFRRRLAREGLDAWWVAATPNVRYLSGFSGEDSALLVSTDKAVLITDSRYEEMAQAEAWVDEVVSRHTTMAKTAAGLCRGLGIRHLGVTSGNLSHAAFEALREALNGVEVRARGAGLVEPMRMRKDAEEVALIRASLRTAEEAFLAFRGQVTAGVSEKELAARLEYEMRARGAEGVAFDTICAAGARASVPHAVPGEARVGAGDAVLFDWGARRDGYCSDLTRVLPTGTIPPELNALVDVVLDAQAAVLGKLKPGVTCGEADAAGRAVVAEAGYGRYFGHGIGHGVGLVVHEGPRIGPGCDTVLLPGMVVTVEPGVYVAGRAGVRIEEMALITGDGHEVLTSLPRRPEELAEAPAGG
jgi:Xaa-Pro aminopeptidase